MAGRFSVEAVFKAIDRITGPVRGMQRAVVRFTGRIESRLKRVGHATDLLGSGIRKIGTAMALSAAVAAPAFADIIRTGAEFEQSLISAGAKFPQMARKGTEAFQRLETSARDVGRTTEFTATQAARGLGFLAMAGFDAQQSIAALPGLVDLATVSELDLARASDIASDTLGAFGLMTQDTAQLTKNLTRVNDVLAKTVTSSNTDMEMLFETIKNAGPIAADAGASIENFTAIAGIMANAGIKASRAGTAMKNMFVRLQAPPAEAQKALDKLRVSTEDAEGNFLGMNKVLGHLLERLPQVGKTQRAQALSAIFGLRAMAGSNVVLSQGVEFLEQYQKNMEGAAGTSKEMAEVIRGSTTNNLKALGSAIESVKISIFTMSEGPLNDLIKRTTMWVRENEKLISQEVARWIANVIENLPEIVEWIGKIAKGLAIFFAFSTAIKTLTAAFTLLNIVMTANPLGLLIVGITLAIGAISMLYVKSQDVIKLFEEMPAVLRIALAPIELLTRKLHNMKMMGDKIKEALNFNGLFEAGARMLGFPQLAGAEGGEGAVAPAEPQVQTPGERLASSFMETLQRQESEVTIRDETGRAEVTRESDGSNLKVERSGEL